MALVLEAEADLNFFLDWAKAALLVARQPPPKGVGNLNSRLSEANESHLS